MRLLWLCLLLETAFHTEAGFGTPYLKNSQLCHTWNCVTDKLGLPFSLPPLDEYRAKLQALLPSGPWQDVVEIVLETCYSNRDRNYVTTCPSQALLHCTVDILIENCPAESLQKDHACNPVSSLAGTKYLFTQSRYENLEKYLPNIKQPAWFMRNYFNSKCCNLPEIVNSSAVKECGFNSFLHYYDHTPRENVQNSQIMKQATTTPKIETAQVPLPDDSATTDPLQCCDMGDFITDSMRNTCNFAPSWGKDQRLHLDTTAASTTVPPHTDPVVINRDFKIVPLSCEKETCIFRKLNIISENGDLDTTAFSKLLDRFTDAHSSWTSAKARVITKCLARPTYGYDEECELNKVLACTLDVLTENCPHPTKNDPCRDSQRNNTLCHISSSKLRPKYRRTLCGLPNLVGNEALIACGVTSASRIEYLPDPPVVKKVSKESWKNTMYECKDNAPVTTCLMSQMGVLNKYGFMDYFKMKDSIRDFTSRQPEWGALRDLYVNAVVQVPRYTGYCSSTKKLLNVLDAMLSTCPVSKRKNTIGCNALFNEITKASPETLTIAKLAQKAQHFSHTYLPKTSPPKPKTTIVSAPLFNFGLLNSSDIPPVQTIYLKPNPIQVRTPVYMKYRSSNLNMDTSNVGNYEKGMFQSTPYLLHGKMLTTKSVPVLIPPGLP